MKMFIVSNVVSVDGEERVNKRAFLTLIQALIAFGKLCERWEAVTGENLALDLGSIQHGDLCVGSDFVVAWPVGGDMCADAKVWIQAKPSDQVESRSVLRRLDIQTR